jgi:SNF2 family DNA or RNA helicase
MTLKQRDEAIEKIEGNQNIKVMIAGLKCGGTGLNFQFANRGIIT